MGGGCALKGLYPGESSPKPGNSRTVSWLGCRWTVWPHWFCNNLSNRPGPEKKSTHEALAATPQLGRHGFVVRHLRRRFLEGSQSWFCAPNCETVDKSASTITYSGSSLSTIWNEGGSISSLVACPVLSTDVNWSRRHWQGVAETCGKPSASR